MKYAWWDFDNYLHHCAIQTALFLHAAVNDCSAKTQPYGEWGSTHQTANSGKLTKQPPIAYATSVTMAISAESCSKYIFCHS